MNRNIINYKIIILLFLIGSVLLSLFTFQSKTAAVASNLIANPSLETQLGTGPENWTQVAWGTNTPKFTYENNGQNGSKSAKIELTSFVDGDVRWGFKTVSVEPNTNYNFSAYYKSNTVADVQIEEVLSDNSYNYLYLSEVSASADWKKFDGVYKSSAAAKTVNIYLSLSRVGWLQTDNYSLISTKQSSSSSNITSSISSFSQSSPVSSSSSSSKTSSVSSVSSISSQSSISSSSSSSSSSGSATELISNPSLETANSTTPANWTKVAWGTNTTNFTYENNGQNGSKSTRLDVTSFVDGDARWAFNSVSVTPNASYNFSAYYKSNTVADVQIEEILSDNTFKYFYVAELQPSTDWKKFNSVYKSSNNAKTVNIYLSLSKVGWLQTDNYSLTPITTSGSSSSVSSSSSSSSSVSNSSSSSSSSSVPILLTTLQKEGKWTFVQTSSVVGIQAVTLPQGKILLYDGSEGDGNGDSKSLIYEIYDTKTRVSTRYNAKNINGTTIQYAAFCSAMVSLPGGRVFFAGGDVNGDAFGSKKSGIFSPLTNTWQTLAQMEFPRWYPSGIVTNNNKILVVGGTQTNYETPAKTPELYTPDTNTWKTLTGATDNFDDQYDGTSHFYPWLYNLTNGKVANIGPSPTISLIGTENNGTIDKFAKRDLYDNDKLFTGRLQIYGSVARISENEILVVGGGLDPKPGEPTGIHDHTHDVFKTSPTETANILRLDLITQPSPVEGIKDELFTQETGRPKVPRTNGTLVFMADGRVMLTGGSTKNENTTRNSQYDNAVRQPEVWDKTTGTWSNLAAHTTRRIYHSIALLQNDGTILQAGGGGFNQKCDVARVANDVSVKGSNACKQIETFEPGYLFDAQGNYKTRPIVTSSNPGALTTGQSFNINSNKQIKKVTFVKPGIVTHGTNIEQYNLQPTVTLNNTSATIKLPDSYYKMPKGNYFMFVWDNTDTPSIAQEISIN